MQELFRYYTLYEVKDRNLVLIELKKFKKKSKIDFSIDDHVIDIVDIDLEEWEIDYILELFDDNDVFPYHDRESDDDEEGDDYFDYFDSDDY
jgi:hypothetical protein